MAKKDADIQVSNIEPAKPQFDFVFHVVMPFANYQKGDRITDDAEIQNIIANNKTRFCVRVAR